MPLARACGLDRPHDLEAVVSCLKPTVLIGVCGQGGAFTKAVVQTMASLVDQPVILPLSNTTSQSDDAVASAAPRLFGGKLYFFSLSPGGVP